MTAMRDTSWIKRSYPGLPPFLIQHGSDDDLVPAEQSMLLARALRGVMPETDVRFDVVPGFLVDRLGIVRQGCAGRGERYQGSPRQRERASCSLLLLERLRPHSMPDFNEEVYSSLANLVDFHGGSMLRDATEWHRSLVPMKSQSVLNRT